MITNVANLLTNSQFRRFDSWMEKFGKLGLYFFCFSFQLNATVAYIALVLMLLAFIAQWKSWFSFLKNETVFYLFISIIVYIIIFCVVSAEKYPESSKDQLIAAENFTHMLMFIPVAWYIYSEAGNLNRVLLVLASGVNARIILHTDWVNINQFLSWNRIGFGYSEIVISQIIGILGLGLLMLAPRIIISAKPSQLSLPRFFFWLINVIVILEALVLTRTRSAWLAAILVFPVALVVRYKHWFKSRNGIYLITLGCLILVLFMGINAGHVKSRMTDESEAVNSILQGDIEKANSISIGSRVQLWRFGLHKFMEKPIFGWGPGTTENLISNSGDPVLSIHPHLHNLYLEILVRFGFFGGSLFGIIIIMLIKGIIKAVKYGSVSLDYAHFLLAGWVFIAIFMFFDFQIFKYVWRNFCVIWAALSYAVRIQNIYNQRQIIE